jgi:catechol 2,3-dioxygenase-like lactoylglutathione lyase family enzyme
MTDLRADSCEKLARMQVIRAGAIIAVSDLAKSLHFYRDQLGLAVDALYDDPPYATLVCAGARISLAQQGFTAPDRPGVVMTAPGDPSKASVALIVEVDNADVARELLGSRGVTFLGPSSYPPWGGSRFFCVDPDGYLVEIESRALRARLRATGGMMIVAASRCAQARVTLVAVVAWVAVSGPDRDSTTSGTVTNRNAPAGRLA